MEGRDLFAGAGAPVDPNRALRDLASFLSAAGEARQYALDQPGSSPEHEGLFPVWVSEAARTNTDALAELSERESTERVAGPAQVGRRWFNVAFLQGEEADAVLDLIDRDGTEAAIAHLSGYDYGEETTQAALDNGYVYDDQPPTGSTDRTVQDGVYALTYNHALGMRGCTGSSTPHPTPHCTRPSSRPRRSSTSSHTTRPDRIRMRRLPGALPSARTATGTPTLLAPPASPGEGCHCERRGRRAGAAAHLGWRRPRQRAPPAAQAAPEGRGEAPSRTARRREDRRPREGRD